VFARVRALVRAVVPPFLPAFLPAFLPTLVRTIACAALLGIAATAQAGRSCEQRPIRPDTLDRSLGLAQRTAASLDASGARVVVLARAGQDLTRYGLTWSHLGIAYRDPTTGHWRIVHKLNHCATAVAHVYRQGLGEFFLDDLWRYEAGFVPLRADLEQRVIDTLVDDRRARQLHTAAYSVVAYPWAQRYQQSNQWAIETLALALDPAVRDRSTAQAWLQLHGYRPTTLRVGAVERLGARITSANVEFDDHPPERRFTGRIDSVTADSVFEWLQRSGLGTRLQRVR
jgi:hypothetical protein